MGSDSDSDHEDYALFGTPLEPIDEEEVPRKRPVPIEEQVATDDQGRRRFHGAFMGGFSAGYFNSVGSKEGWKPKEFVSSRNQKPDLGKFSQKPEDFMDEEDMGAFGFAPQVLRASSKFQKDQEKETLDRKRKVETNEPLLAHALINNILRPARETIGFKLLSEMGWRPGQGIGPKLTRRQKDRIQKSHVRLFGPTLPPGSSSRRDESDEENEEDDEFSNKYREFLFAPDDLPSFVLTPKENQHGIGYKGLDRTSVLGNLPTSGHINLFEMPSTSAGGRQKPGKGDNKNRKGLKISGQAFGIGVYEEEDEDIYARDDMSNYDFALPMNKDETRQDDRQKRGSASRWGAAVDKVGGDCIEGFELDARDEASTSLRCFYPPPEIPKNWQPRFLRSKPSRFEQEKHERAKNLNPSERKAIIETEPVKPSEATLPTKSDEQLQKLLSTNMDQEEMSKSLSFKPFAAKPEKQTRYEKYLVCVKNNRGDALHLLQPKTMTEWERDREKVEFERAALLYKPLNTSMASRFVSAGTSEEADNAGKNEDVDDSKTNDATKAVKLKLFGKLTHEKIEWHPAKLLCIRFNVKHPYSDYSVIGVPTSHKSKFDIFGRLENSQTEKSLKEREETFREPVTDNPEPMDVSVVEKVTEEKVEEVENVKPPIDLFKSIFLDTDESDSDDDEETTKPEEIAKSSPEQKEEPVNLDKSDNSRTGFMRKPFTGKGLFANIDFDRLNKRGNSNQNPTPVEEMKKPAETKTDKIISSKFPSSKSEKIEEQEDVSYGPAKPASLQVSRSAHVSSESEDYSSDEEVWKEKKPSDKASKKKKKKDKKKKSKKVKKSDKRKKDKKKKKKKKRESDSTTDTDDSDD